MIKVNTEDLIYDLEKHLAISSCPHTDRCTKYDKDLSSLPDGIGCTCSLLLALHSFLCGTSKKRKKFFTRSHFLNWQGGVARVSGGKSCLYNIVPFAHRAAGQAINCCNKLHCVKWPLGFTVFSDDGCFCVVCHLLLFNRVQITTLQWSVNYQSRRWILGDVRTCHHLPRLYE